MVKRSSNSSATTPPSAAEVEALVRAHPQVLADVLARCPELLAEGLPERDLGEAVADLQAHALRRLRAEMAELRNGAEELILNARDNMSLQGHTHDAALALLGAGSFDQLVRVVTDDLPLTLHVDLVTLCFEPGLPKGAAIYVQELPAGAVDRLIGADTAMCLRPSAKGDEVLYGAGAGLVASDALVRLPLTGPDLPPGLLALGSRRADAFHAGMATDLLAFLTAVTAHCVERWVRP